jgi:hypothetical protein
LRAKDQVHCCWAKQAWSAARQLCVGIPQCPAGFEIDRESCVSLDKDNDGIPNAKDRCPDEAEDANGFEDDDGCPDEPRRQSLAAAEEEQKRQAVEAEEHRRKLEQEAEKKRVQEEAERRRQEAAAKEQALRDAEKAERERQQAAERAEAERRGRIAAARARRTWGYALAGGGLASGAGAVVFLLLGNSQNSTIKNGNLATANDISSAASSGATDNSVAIGLGITGAVACAVGIPLILSGRTSPSDEKPAAAVSLSPLPHGAGLLTTVRFQ